MDKYYSIASCQGVNLVWFGTPHLQLRSLKAYK